MLQKTLFGKAARTALAASSAATAVEVQHTVVERMKQNKQRQKPSPNQIANFLDKNIVRKLTQPVTAKSLGAISHIIPIPPPKNKPSKWLLHCRRLEEKTLKETLGLDGRLVRPQAALSPSAKDYEDHRERKKRAPTTQLISELKGVPEKGKLVRDNSRRDPEKEKRKKVRMAEAIRTELVREVTQGDFPTFDANIEEGRAEIVDVTMSSDLRRATILFMAPPLAQDANKAAKDWATRFDLAKRHLRSIIASRIRTKFVPELEFRLAGEAIEATKQAKKAKDVRKEEVRVLKGFKDILEEEESLNKIEEDEKSVENTQQSANEKYRKPSTWKKRKKQNYDQEETDSLEAAAPKSSPMDAALAEEKPKSNEESAVLFTAPDEADSTKGSEKQEQGVDEEEDSATTRVGGRRNRRRSLLQRSK